MSETSLIREAASKYCIGKGLDLGCGGDKLTPETWGFDMPIPYTHVGNDTIELRGDARNLSFINNNSIDYIFSSHLLEDFPNTEEVLREWFRVIKPGGLLMLYLPHEMRYRAHCKATGQDYNGAHSVEQMSLDYILEILKTLGISETVEAVDSHAAYSFFVVARK